MRAKTIFYYFKNRINYLRTKIFIRETIKNGDFGLKYFISPGSSLDFIINKNGFFIDDWNVLCHLTETVSKDGTVIDIGANVGHLSLLFAKQLVPNGKVYSYEPDPENIQYLKKNITINKLQNVQVCETALQDNKNISLATFNIRRTIDGDGNENKGLSSLKEIPKFKKNPYKLMFQHLIKILPHTIYRGLILLKLMLKVLSTKFWLEEKNLLKNLSLSFSMNIQTYLII